MEATSEDFERKVLTPRGTLIVVDFHGPGCPNCAAFAADAPRLIEALGDESLCLVKVDAYASPELAERFGLVGVPTFLFVRDGKVLGRMTGYHGREYWLDVVRGQLARSSS